MSTEIEKAAGLEAQHRQMEDLMYESDQKRKGYREALEKNRESSVKVERSRQILEHLKKKDMDYVKQREKNIEEQVKREMLHEQYESLAEVERQKYEADLAIYRQSLLQEEIESPLYIKRGIELAARQLAAKSAMEHQKYLEDTNEAIQQNQRAQAAMYIVKFAKDNNVDIDLLTENIGEHLSDPKWEVPEHMKPALVQEATKFVEGNVGRFLRRDQTFRELIEAIHHASQGQSDAFDQAFAENEINIFDKQFDVHHLGDEEFNRQVGLVYQIIKQPRRVHLQVANDDDNDFF